MSPTTPRVRGWFLAALVVALGLATPACGGDDEETDTAAERPSAPTETLTEETATETAETEPSVDTETETEDEDEDEGVETETSPERQPGGAGDEIPARSLAQFTGKGGRITPRVIRVPAFLSIRVELRSADGMPYGLDFGGEAIRVSDGLGSVSTSFDGLRPGEVLVGTPIGAGNRVRVSATAEPGP